MDDDTAPDKIGSSLRRTLHHLATFWAVRDQDNVVMLHYHDLQTDLGVQMRELAERLALDVPEERWVGLIDAATFDRMRANADQTVPSGASGQWHDNREFFRRGTSGQWRELLEAGDLRRYDARVAELAAPDLAAWAHPTEF